MSNRENGSVFWQCTLPDIYTLDWMFHAISFFEIEWNMIIFPPRSWNTSLLCDWVVCEKDQTWPCSFPSTGIEQLGLCKKQSRTFSPSQFWPRALRVREDWALLCEPQITGVTSCSSLLGPRAQTLFPDIFATRFKQNLKFSSFRVRT